MDPKYSQNNFQLNKFSQNCALVNRIKLMFFEHTGPVAIEAQS